MEFDSQQWPEAHPAGELPAARHIAVQSAAITRAVIDACRCSEAGTLQHLLEALPAQATFEDKALQAELFKVKAVVVRALGLDAAVVQQRSAQHCRPRPTTPMPTCANTWLGRWVSQFDDNINNVCDND